MNLNRKNVLDMSASEARMFFLKPNSYVPILLPEYFDFQPVLDYSQKKLAQNSLSSMINSNVLLENDKVNHTILLNKDAGYDWRPVQVIHPLLYVNLVKLITQKENWNELLTRFKKFREDEQIECISMPVESTDDSSDTAETILNWWEEMEQNSIVKSLQYSCCIRTDVTNCYGSIYTHTIDWAIRGKSDAKQNKTKHRDRSLGHELDFAIEQLQCGQTNGIPQGGVLFDFIAEIVLGYSDSLLSERLKKQNITGWSIIRYRDDYRVFSNSVETAESVVKNMSDVLSELNMHFNSKKTGITNEIVESAIKPDKVYWNSRIPIIMPHKGEGKTKKFYYQMTLQKHLLEILWLSKRYPNSGSINKALTAFARRLDEQARIEEQILPLISIVADIISNNPKAIPAGVGVLSKLLVKGDNDKTSINDVVSQITQKLENTPNLSFLDIWLQRLTILTDGTQTFSEKLCDVVQNPDHEIWDSSFIKSNIKLPSIVNTHKAKSLRSEIATNVFDVFSFYD